jgi:nitrite reductase/ring-hydroxylating ferredoxin subunit
MSQSSGGTVLPLHKNIQGIPSVRDFPRYPASWYLLCKSREVTRGALKRSIFGREIVLFRGENGRVIAMDNRCAHLGADLSQGRIAGDTISCPFHGWRYDGSGRCVKIPGGAAIPLFARQAIFPVEERHGLVFVFNGPEGLFPLPFFAAEEPDNFVAAQAAEFIAETSWFMVAAHGYDLQHFETAHGRRLVSPLAVDCPAPFARRSRYCAEIAGANFYDWLLRHGLNRHVTITITTWGGTLVLVTGDFGSVRSQFLISLLPVAENRTVCSVVVFARKSTNRLSRWLSQRLNLALRKSFTRGYLVGEAVKLGRPHYLPHHLIQSDGELIDFFRWTASLPQSRSALVHSAPRHI